MALLQLQNFTALVNNAIASTEGACAQLLDFSVGTISRALLESSATTALWLQWLILQVLSLTRASTSNGLDLDSFYADFGFTRLNATYATGSLALLRNTATAPAVVFPGGQVKTLDGTQGFIIVADANNATGDWDVPTGTYQADVGDKTVDVLVVAANPGTQGNVAAGTIGLVASAIPGIDYCSNALPFSNAMNAETDAAFRVRFQLYINSRTLATKLALQNAIASTQQGLSSFIAESSPALGFTTAYVDDGSGAVPIGVLTQLAAACNAVRALGGTVYVLQAPVVLADINVIFTSAPGYSHATQIGLIAAAVAAVVEALPVGATLPYAQIAATVFGATPGIQAVPALTINGVPDDLAPIVPGIVIRLGALSVT